MYRVERVGGTTVTDQVQLEPTVAPNMSVDGPLPSTQRQAADQQMSDRFHEEAAQQSPSSGGNRWHSELAVRVFLVDTLALMCAGAVALALVASPYINTNIGRVSQWAIAITAAASWIASSAWARRRDHGLTVAARVRYVPAAAMGTATFAATCVAIALLGVTLPITLLVAPFVIGIGVDLWGRRQVRRWAIRGHATGQGRRGVIIVGSSAEVSSFGPALTAMGGAVHMVGACISDDYDGDEILLDVQNRSEAGVQTIPVLGTTDDIARVAADHQVSTVLLASAEYATGGLSAFAWQMDQIGASLSLLSSTNDVAEARVQRETVRGATLVHVARPTYRGALRIAKRLLDIVAAFGLLVIFAVPMLIASIAIKTSSRGPVFFKQERVGLGGERFIMWKFRSMVVDAEERRADLEHQQDAGNAVMFKMKQDPRVTRIGQLLRRTSLDELPQLINVLGGSMSLVGPRPPLPQELSQYDELALRRFLVKPGITGLWQVSGRSDLTWEQTVRCDRRYVENWSIASDAAILVRTVGAMNKGAY